MHTQTHTDTHRHPHTQVPVHVRNMHHTLIVQYLQTAYTSTYSTSIYKEIISQVHYVVLRCEMFFYVENLFSPLHFYNYKINNYI